MLYAIVGGIIGAFWAGLFVLIGYYNKNTAKNLREFRESLEELKIEMDRDFERWDSELKTGLKP